MRFRFAFGLFYLVLGSVLIFFASPQMGPLQLTSADKRQVKPIQADMVSVVKGDTKGDHLLGEKALVQAVLRSAGLEKWHNLPGLHYKIKVVDFYSTQGEEILVAVSLSPDQGVLGVVGKSAGGYIVVAVIEDLAPVTNIGIINLPGMDHSAVVIEEYLNELIGGFFEMARLSVYGVVDSQVQRLWQREKYVKAYWNEQWDNRTPRWLQHFEQVDIRFYRDGRIVGQGEKQFLVAEDKSASLPLPEQFRLFKTDPVYFLYQWEPGSLSFKFSSPP